MPKYLLCSLLAAISCCTLAHGEPITLGYFYLDTSDYTVNIQNLTAANSDGTDAPVVNQVNFTNLDLYVVSYDFEYPLVDVQDYYQSSFTALPDGSYLGPQVPDSTFSLSLFGDLDTTTFHLTDGETLLADTNAFAIYPDPANPLYGVITVDATAAVPEPSSIWLFGFGLAGLLCWRAWPRYRAPICRLLPLAIVSAAGAATLHLSVETLPPSGTAGIQTVALTGSGFPAGQTASGIAVLLEKSCGVTTGAYTTMARTYTPVVGSVGQVRFVVPGDVPTGSYFVQLSATDLSSSNCTQIQVVNQDPQWKACPSGGSIGVLAGDKSAGSKAVTAYIPDGHWSGGSPGIRVVPIEGTGLTSSIATPDVVNSCSSNPNTGESACTTNNVFVYFLQGTSLAKTVQDPNATVVNADCSLCSVNINQLSNKAMVMLDAIATTVPTDYGSIAGLQDDLDLTSGQIVGQAPLINQTREGFSDPYRKLTLAPGDSSFDLIQYFGSNGEESINLGLGGYSSPGEDCSTGIGFATQGTTLLLTDLTQLSIGLAYHFTQSTWTAPSQTYTLSPFSPSSFGRILGAVAAPGTTHLGVLSTGQMAGAIKLPSQSGFGVPAPADFVAFSMPNDPDGKAFNSGYDPPSLTAYTSPSNGKAYGLIADWKSGSPRYVAVIDLAAALAAPRSAAHLISASYDLIQHGVVRYVATF